MKKPPRLKHSKTGVLLQNTVMLYILTFSNYFLSFIIGTYQSRVLKPAVFGVLGTANAIMIYFQLIIDFGYLLYGTRDIAQNREDSQKISRTFSTITLGKLGLTGASALVLLLLCQVIPTWRDKTGLYFLFFCATALNSLLPDYLYRGLEKMSSITIRTVCIRVFFTLGTLLLLKKPEDVWIIPALNAIGNLVAVVLTMAHIHRKLNIRFVLPSMREILKTMKHSSVFFYSRIATTAYSAFNTVILDVISASGAVVGYYNAADRLMTTGKSALSPISDSLYPYMVKNRDFKLVKKVLLIIEPCVIAFCICCFIWAEPLMMLIFGAEYAAAAPVLRAMLPVGAIILPSYILGFPTLTAMGLTEHANYSVIFGSVVHVVNLGILYFTGNISMLTLGCAVSIAEALILGYRVVIIWRHRDLLRKERNS